MTAENEEVDRVAVAIRQAYADDTANGEAEACGEVSDWHKEAQAAIAAMRPTAAERDDGEARYWAGPGCEDDDND
jgi:hypothetical protein